MDCNRGIQYLNELAVLEMIYDNPINVQSPTHPDEVQCTQVQCTQCTRQKFVIVCQLIGSSGLERQSATDWLKWLANSGNTKTMSLPLLFQLWRNCPGSSSNSESICPAPRLYRPASQQ